MLTAEELLQNKGIKGIAWDEYEKSSNVLPKTGQKQFEPNGSWLQNMQIEKGLKNRKELLSVERVERSSQLAIAEWLPAQRKAQVKKSSGQDWSSFGLEKNSTLYLIPEEALFLLEANCLELLWNGQPLSIQQAYEQLIDNVECCMEEYRVYSQLARYGYRIQRYIYQNGEKEDNGIKRKVIIEPGNGLRMSEGQQLVQCSQNTTVLETNEKQTEKTEDLTNDSKSPNDKISKQTDTDVTKDVSRVMIQLLDSVECLSQRDNETHTKNTSNSQTVEESNGTSKQPSKIGIISEETLSTNIKVIRQNVKSVSKDVEEVNPKGWRIHRNVKLIPKRVDKHNSNEPSGLNSCYESNGHSPEKRKPSTKVDSPNHAKKSRQEIIELSDDEIQELPQPTSKLELLNFIPNIACGKTYTSRIVKRYIPPNIQPQKTIYEYDTVRLRHLQESDKYLQRGSNTCNNIVDRSPYNHSSAEHQPVRYNSGLQLPNLQINMNFQNPLMPGFFGFPRISFNNVMAAPYYKRFNNVQQFPHTENKSSPTINTTDDNDYYSSFKKIPGTSSWSDLKTRWREEKTITIDDEENTNKENNDSSEIQVVGRSTCALIGSNNASSLAEVFEKLRIIKPASEKGHRRKRSKYKISYNVYSNSQHYTKSNPGMPLCRIVVIRQTDDQHIQASELCRLHRGSNGAPIVLACVSMSISYIQPGFVTLPNLA